MDNRLFISITSITGLFTLWKYFLTVFLSPKLICLALYKNWILSLLSINSAWSISIKYLINKCHIVFLDESNDQKVNVVVNIGTTIEQLIKMYLYKAGGLELIDDYYSKKNICFSYNNQNIAKCGEKIVEKFLSKCALITIILRHLN